MAGRSAKRLSFLTTKMFESVFAFSLRSELFVTACEVAVVFRFYITSFVLFRVAALADPFRAQSGNADA